MEKNRAASEKDIRNEQKTEIGFMWGLGSPLLKLAKTKYFRHFFLGEKY